jgi:carbonic anhydrase/acetyltransferase-like protein (isoleucine patch superfamily)
MGHNARLIGATVEGQVLVAIGAVVLPGARVGTLSIIAANATVPEGMWVPPRSLVMGVPARIVRQVDERLSQRIAATWMHYVKQASAHHAGHYPMLQPGD